MARTDPAPEPPAPPRVLGTLDTTGVVVGAIIGVGIFFTPSQVASLAGTSTLALAAWALAGAIALCGALTFAELGARVHGSGAQYQVLRDAYGPATGFVFVFCNATAVQAGAIGVIAMICVRHLAQAAGASPPTGWAMAGLATLLVLGVTIANILGARWGARIQNLTVFAKVATLLAIAGLAVAGAPGRSTETQSHASGGVAGVLAALVPAFFAYGGWQHALWISGEVRNPQRTLPRAIIAGTLLVVIVYLLANVSYIRLLGIEGVKASRTLAADAVGAVLPGLGSRLIAAAVAVSAFGVLNAQFLTGPRLLYALSRDGRFFRVFGGISPMSRTPAPAIALLSITSLVLLALCTLAPMVGFGEQALELLLAGAVSIDGVFFALTGAGVFLLRRRPAEPGGFRVPFYPAIPALFVLGAVGIVVGAFIFPSTRPAAFVGLGWIAAACVIYAVGFADRSAVLDQR